MAAHAGPSGIWGARSAADARALPGASQPPAVKRAVRMAIEATSSSGAAPCEAAPDPEEASPRYVRSTSAVVACPATSAICTGVRPDASGKRKSAPPSSNASTTAGRPWQRMSGILGGVVTLRWRRLAALPVLALLLMSCGSLSESFTATADVRVIAGTDELGASEEGDWLVLMRYVAGGAEFHPMAVGPIHPDDFRASGSLLGAAQVPVDTSELGVLIYSCPAGGCTSGRMDRLLEQQLLAACVPRVEINRHAAEALTAAAYHGRVDVVEALVERGASVTWRNGRSETAMIRAGQWDSSVAETRTDVDARRRSAELDVQPLPPCRGEGGPASASAASTSADRRKHHP